MNSIQKLFKNYSWLSEIIDFNKPISPSHLDKKDLSWKSVTFLPELYAYSIYQYVYKSKGNYTLRHIEDYCVETTQRIKKGISTDGLNIENAFSKSHNGNVSRIINIFHIKKAENIDINKLENISYDKFIEVIERYINEMINNEKEEFSIRHKDKWNEYYDNKLFIFEKTYDTDQIYKYINEIKLDNPNYKLNDNFLLDINNKENSIFINKVQEKNNVIIGNIGETLAFNYFKEIYKEYDVILTNKFNPYENHDITIKNKETGEIIYYIEVKSSYSIHDPKFYLSRNEFNLYKNNKDKYIIVFVNGINMNINYKPIFTILKSPEIEVSLEYIGFKNNKLLISPLKYEGIIKY